LRPLTSAEFDSQLTPVLTLFLSTPAIASTAKSQPALGSGTRGVRPTEATAAALLISLALPALAASTPQQLLQALAQAQKGDVESLSYFMIMRRQIAAAAADVFRVLLIISMIKPTRCFLGREWVALRHAVIIRMLSARLWDPPAGWEGPDQALALNRTRW